MSPLLVCLLGALLIPLFLATWRASLLGLAFQGLIMAGIALPELTHQAPAQAWLTLFDLGVVRGLVLPVALYTALRATGAPSRNDVISPNLFSWMIALGLVLAAFNFSEALVSEPGEPQTLVAIAIAGVLLGFLVLASAAGPFGQMVGALRIENAIALLELSGSHRASLGMRLALLGIFLATLGIFRWHLLSTASPAKEGEHAPDSFTL
ncbi:MAG: putative transrane protein involved in the pathway [Pseudomonadota bacterium]|jgi:hydrogenase-4 membrane subunit HyfE